jgi:hypothetical protein
VSTQAPALFISLYSLSKCHIHCSSDGRKCFFCPLKTEKMWCDYTGLSSLFSPLQCVSSHPNSRSSDLLTAGRFRTQPAPPAYSALRLEQHTTLRQPSPQGISIIDLTESGEINLSWYDHEGMRFTAWCKWWCLCLGHLLQLREFFQLWGGTFGLQKGVDFQYLLLNIC